MDINPTQAPLTTHRAKRCLALIASTNSEVVQTQYDTILAAISYDWDVTVVFFPAAAQTHLGTAERLQNRWKALPLYGIEKLYVLDSPTRGKNDLAVPLENITSSALRKAMQECRWTI